MKEIVRIFPEVKVPKSGKKVKKNKYIITPDCESCKEHFWDEIEFDSTSEEEMAELQIALLFLLDDLDIEEFYNEWKDKLEEYISIIGKDGYSDDESGSISLVGDIANNFICGSEYHHEPVRCYIDSFKHFDENGVKTNVDFEIIE